MAPHLRETTAFCFLLYFSNKLLRRSEVTANKLCHLEHRNNFFSTEYSAKLVISVDVASFFSILKIVLLDVRPKFFSNFSTWNRLVTYNFSECIAYLHRRHKLRIRLTLS